MSDTITIEYTCEECGIEKRELIVPERKRAVDVVYWMKMVGSSAAYDHAALQPQCNAKTFTLMIPVAGGATMIGRNSE